MCTCWKSSLFLAFFDGLLNIFREMLLPPNVNQWNRMSFIFTFMRQKNYAAHLTDSPNILKSPVVCKDRTTIIRLLTRALKNSRRLTLHKFCG